MASTVGKLSAIAIQTERLILREWTEDQFNLDNMYNLESLPEVVRYQEWGPRSRDKAAEVVRTIVKNQSQSPRKHVELAVVTRPMSESGSGDFVGRVGANVRHDLSPVKADLWFAFLPTAQGKGYAAEAMQSFIDVLSTSGVITAEIECDPRNRGSRRLAERLGFTKIKEVEGAWESKGEWVGSVEYTKQLG